MNRRLHRYNGDKLSAIRWNDCASACEYDTYVVI